MLHLNPYDCAYQFAYYTNRSFFITGKAGTGKTTFLRKLKDESRKQMAVAAPTGVAAINAGGVTIHSFFQLPFTPFIPTPQGRKSLMSKVKIHASRRRVLREIELLVIDEISMVRADVLDAIDTVLRSVRYRQSEPFGGVQMIFIGDMYQLSPVVQSGEWQILSGYYKGIYFFDSRVINEQPPVYIEFDKIFRQSDDRFIRLLNEVRNDALTQEGLELLQSRYNPAAAAENDSYIMLTTHNYKADSINNTKLAKIDTVLRLFRAKIKGDFPENAYPVEETLELKVGAKVMFVKNDTESPRRFFNGKRGEVTKINSDDSICVKCPEDKETIIVTPVIWENIRYKANEVTATVDEEVLGTFTQYPLRLAWAITIHKSQGLTFDKAIIDAENAFSPGQIYVALSRCSSLEGLILQSPVNRYKTNVDERIVQYSLQTTGIGMLNNQLLSAKGVYHLSLLMDLFSFEGLRNIGRVWFKMTKDNESSYNDEALPFIEDILNQLKGIEQVAEKFRLQLENIMQREPVDIDFMNKRLKASADYFSGKIDVLMDTLSASPVTTDNRSNGNRYDENISSLFLAAAQKKHIILSVTDGFNVDTYFTARGNFIMPEFTVSAYSRNTTKQQLKSINPDLLHRLVELRNTISDSEDMPVYIIAAAKTLAEVANRLPRTEKELLKIHGFGKVKAERYGAKFLEVVNNYIKETGDCIPKGDITFDSPEPVKEKKQKGASMQETFRMYEEGLSITEIAGRRNLAESTIASHLARFVCSGQIPLSDFITSEKVDRAERRLERKKDDELTSDVLKDFLSTIEMSIFLAWRRFHK
jgi:hypothetical protein